MLLLLLMIMGFQGDTISTSMQNLDEVVVSARGQGGHRSEKGQVASIDEHLSQLRNVSLVRRGSYAWEPVVNNMQMERLSTTIDGMKIFYACTDKMDPVTSYVESGNLQSISMNSGLDGNPQATGNIGGSLDLRLKKVGFDNVPFQINASAGHELNGHLAVYGADNAVSRSRYYANVGAFYRHADNYKAGGGEEILFSQFSKVNAFANMGWRLAARSVVEGTFIFDRATDVGYPALNMDVALAQAFISSLSYKHLFQQASWETKFYYNRITHEMDDTHRPDVEIHMDMPGRSWTSGCYSLFTVTCLQHSLQFNYDLFYNRRFADMTMYPGGAAPMYMVTWPDVGTFNTGLAFSDNVQLGEHHSLRLSAKMAWQQQHLNNEEGYHALRVFFPAMKDRYHQTTGRVAASYQYSTHHSQFTIGAGWGSRAPTITEAYGYYLNNTYDQYDYMGNPTLKNESAIELNSTVRLSTPDSRFSIALESNAFFFSNYIIGQFEQRLSPMTVGAEGVKVYANLSHATIANVSLSARWMLTRHLRLHNKVGYGLGYDAEGGSLPMIAPLTWQSSAQYAWQNILFQASVKGHARQSRYGDKYGELPSDSWAILNLSAQYTISHYTFRLGVENLFDKYYTTYSDWKKIPQKGRNIYANITFDF